MSKKWRLPRLVGIEGMVAKPRWMAPTEQVAPVYELDWFGEGGTDNYLPGEVAERVFLTRFVLTDKQLAVAEYLRWTAESQYQNPLRSFWETAQRDFLFEHLVVAPVKAYFQWLHEHVVIEGADPDWWLHWHHFAGIIWWSGRTGRVMIDGHAAINGSDYYPHVKTPRWMREEWPSVAERRQKWFDRKWQQEDDDGPPTP